MRSMHLRLAFILAIGIAACGSDEPRALMPAETPTSCVGGATVSPTNVSLRVRETTRLTVVGTSCNVKTTVWKWTESDTTIVSVDSLSGTVRALKPGIASVTAYSAADPVERSSAAVVVSP